MGVEIWCFRQSRRVREEEEAVDGDGEGDETINLWIPH